MTSASFSVPARVAQVPYHTSGCKQQNTGSCLLLQNKSKLTALEDRNMKLEYQILHLKRAVKDGDTALKAVQPQQ